MLTLTLATFVPVIIAILIPWLATPAHALPSLIKLTSYAPVAAECPSSGLTRDAIGLCSGEAEYRTNRSKVASQHLREWFTAVNKDMPEKDRFEIEKGVEMPVIGLASSGGGIGSMVNNAGLVQAWDNRDSSSVKSNMKGFYQSISYHAGTSTGAWLLGG
ncbi:Lysophospholipase 3 [Cyphellophora attinorum]|uniref:Lysophospholipase n=1 Tax=Cyphellophora attinorum TaxID=1664694 RepID=A0A0N1I0E4_9EURO|nr:Lysophospholipase 3 [Phialophora attinorum]KPI44932.1 Lysophospholipase 3 [Phialophora attinorum]